MTFTSNEITCITTAILIVHGSLVAWLMIKTQHAKNAEEAMQEVKNIFVRLIFWACNLGAVAILFMQFTSSSPVTRRDVFIIVTSVSILFLSLLVALLLAMKEMMKYQKLHVESTRQIANILKETIPNLPNKKDTPA